MYVWKQKTFTAIAYFLEPFFTSSCNCSWCGIFSSCQTITKAIIRDSFFSTAFCSISSFIFGVDGIGFFLWSFYFKNNRIAFRKWQCSLLPFYMNLYKQLPKRKYLLTCISPGIICRSCECRIMSLNCEQNQGNISSSCVNSHDFWNILLVFIWVKLKCSHITI